MSGLRCCCPAPARRGPCTRRAPRGGDADGVWRPSPDPWSLEAPPPSVDQQQRILMERAAARAPAARPLPSGFGAVPPGMPSGFGKRAKAALAGASSHGDAYQRGVIRCAACLVDRYPQRLLMIMCAAPCPAEPRDARMNDRLTASVAALCTETALARWRSCSISTARRTRLAPSAAASLASFRMTQVPC